MADGMTVAKNSYQQQASKSHTTQGDFSFGPPPYKEILAVVGGLKILQDVPRAIRDLLSPNEHTSNYGAFQVGTYIFLAICLGAWHYFSSRPSNS